MAFIEDILEELRRMEIDVPGGGFGDIGGINPFQIASGLRETYGLSEEQFPEHLVRPISEGLIGGVLAKTYSPLVETSGKTKLQELKDKIGTTGTSAFGGFSGSGQQHRFMSGIKDEYGRGMTGILQETGKSRTMALKQIMDAINRWKASAVDIRGYK